MLIICLCKFKGGPCTSNTCPTIKFANESNFPPKKGSVPEDTANEIGMAQDGICILQLGFLRPDTDVIVNKKHVVMFTSSISDSVR